MGLAYCFTSYLFFNNLLFINSYFYSELDENRKELESSNEKKTDDKEESIKANFVRLCWAYNFRLANLEGLMVNHLRTNLNFFLTKY